MNFAGFIAGSYQTSSRAGDVERTVNLYLETIQSGQGAPNSRTLNRTPGLNSVWEVGGRTRGMLSLTVGGVSGIWTVQADRLFLLDSSYTIPVIPAFPGGFGPFIVADDNQYVQMCADPVTLLLVSAGVLYTLNSLGLQTPALSFTPKSCAFVKNWFVALAADGRQFYFMDTDDPNLTIAWDPSAVQTAEADANDLVRLFADHQQLWIFGSRVTQVFNVGNDPNAPFEPNDSAVITMGIGASASVVSLDNSVFCIAKNNDGGYVVVRFNGYTPIQVSDYGIENAMSNMTPVQVEEAVAWTHLNKGHLCYRITFPGANQTWEYDVREKNWYEVLYFNEGSSGLYEAHRGYVGCSAFGKTVVGDRDNGKIYEMSTAFNDDDGDRIHCLRRAPHILEEMRNVAYGELELVAQVGIGDGSVLADDPNQTDESDPKVRLRYSDDNAVTWSNELERSLGKQGKTKQQLIWSRLGVGRNRVFEISTSTKSGPICFSGVLLTDTEALAS